MEREDLAFILTWPDTTIRGDEKWMMLFKKIGIVKNLNFKVGHTGIVIVERQTGDMLYYDFGRYITPRGYGRARSKFSDPRLDITLKAKFDGERITNIEEIVTHFELLKLEMKGEGILYFSIARDISFTLAKKYADHCVLEGSYPYGAVARGNNNCSRFIVRMLMCSSVRYNWFHSINFPETIKASPISNVVNATSDRIVYLYSRQKGLIQFKMNRFQSVFFLLKKLRDNVQSNKAKLLPNDQIIGCMLHTVRPRSIPYDAQYLGGVGDGAWYHLQPTEDGMLIVKRFNSDGELEYAVLGEAATPLALSLPWKITYDSHLLFTHVIQKGRKILIYHKQQLAINSSRLMTTHLEQF